VGDGPCWSSEKSAVPATLNCWRQSLAEREVLDAARWMRAKIARLGPESGDVFLSGPAGLAAAGMPGGLGERGCGAKRHSRRHRTLPDMAEEALEGAARRLPWLPRARAIALQCPPTGDVEDVGGVGNGAGFGIAGAVGLGSDHLSFP